MKKKLIEGLDCVLCGRPAQTLHHPTKCKTQFEYFNDETQIPMCLDCHYSKCHIMSKVFPATKKMKEINPDIISFQICRGGGFD